VSIHQHIVSGIPGYEDSLAMDVNTIIEAAHQGSENIVSRLFSKLVPQFRTTDNAADADEAIARMSGQSQRVDLGIKS
jgi:tyrosine-protein phosphatase YwqE